MHGVRIIEATTPENPTGKGGIWDGNSSVIRERISSVVTSAGSRSPPDGDIVSVNIMADEIGPIIVGRLVSRKIDL
jgi:hypothetical protein